MLALHRGRTALTLACLLAAATGASATHAPTADASFGQIKSAFGSLGTAPGQLSVLGGISYRPATSQLYAADQYTDDNTGDPVFRIQRLAGGDGAPADPAGLWVDDDYLGGWQGGLTYTGDIAVDPRAGQSHLYARMVPQDVNAAGGKVLEIDPDAPTPNPANAAPAPKAVFPVVAGVGQLNAGRGLAVSPSTGEILVGDAATPADGAPPVVRTFSGAAGHAAGATIALAAADIAPPDAGHDGARHAAVVAIATRADGTVAVLSAAQPTMLSGGTVVDDPDALTTSLVDVYSPARVHLAGFALPKLATTIAFAPDGHVAIPDLDQLGSVAEYDPTGATPATPVSRFGTLSTDAAPAPCSFWDAPTLLAGTAADLYAADRRPLGSPPDIRVVHFGDGGRGCGPKVHDAKITLSTAAVIKGQPVTITGSAINDGGALPDSAYSWSVDGTTRSGPSFSYTFATTGSKTIKLSVDNGYSVITAEETVRVSSIAPVASFAVSGDGATAPATIGFDASASSDADGPIAEYRWDTDADGKDDATGVRISHLFATAGPHTVRLTVVDGDGDQNTTRRTVTVAAPASAAPIETPKDPAPPTNLGGQSAALQPGKAIISLGSALTPDAKGKVKVKLSCPTGTSGCSGTLTLVSAKALTAAKGKAKKKVLTLASARYTVAAGGSSTVTLTLSSGAKAALRKLHAVAVLATATGADGGKVTATGTVKAARKGKR